MDPLSKEKMVKALDRLNEVIPKKLTLIVGYDQDKFAEKHHYTQRPIEPALKAVEGAISTTAQLLDLMSEDDWKRAGEHSETGPYSAETWLQIYAVHAQTHAEQIRESRAAFKEGK